MWKSAISLTAPTIFSPQAHCGNSELLHNLCGEKSGNKNPKVFPQFTFSHSTTPVEKQRNAKFIMHNAKLWCPMSGRINIMPKGHTFIMHFAFYILHLCYRQELMLAVMSRILFCKVSSPFFSCCSTLRMA